MNTKTKILSFLLAIVMILTVVPALTVSAAEPVDLIHESDGKTVKDGVFFTYEGGIYGSDVPEKAINGNDDHGWRSAFWPSATPWYQLNFPLASQWTKIRLKMAAGDYKCAIKVLASNDPSFETGTYDVIEETSEFKSTILIEDASKFTKAYRYFRIVAKGDRLGVMEIDITGYEPVAPSTEGLVDLAQKPDVYAKVATEEPETYTAQQVLDGNDATGYTVTGGTTPELMVDLRRESAVKIVEFTPVAGNEAYRKDYEIHASNDPTFADYSVLYKNTNKVTADGVAVRAYMPDGKSARYVRIKADGADLGVAELKVWGSEGEFALENMVSAEYVSATSGANPECTVDGDVSTVWTSAEEATKASITYELAGINPVTSIMLLPANGEESRKNFNIYGYLTDDSDAELIKAVGDTPLALGQYEVISLDEPKTYKKIKIEKAAAPSLAESLAFREVKIIHNSLDAVVKVEATSPANGATGVTNFGDNPALLTNFIEVELNRNIVKSSINPTNVVIKDITEGSNTVLTDWEAYEVSGKKFSIDVANLKSNKTYEVTLTTNIQTTSGALGEESKFTFTTGNIISVPYDPDKVLINIVTGKDITGNRLSSYGPLTNIIDGDNSTFALSSGAPKFQIDLGNVYNIVAFELVPKPNSATDGHIKGLKVLGSGKSINYEEATAVKLTEITLATYPEDSTKTESFVLDSPANVRYLGLYRASTYIALSEFKAYAYVDKDTIDVGAWKMLKDNVETAEFSAAGTYKFSIPVNNLSESETSYYMTVFAYTEDGQMIQKANKEKTVASGKQTISSEVTLSADDFTKAARISAVLYKSFDNAQMIVDGITIKKQKPADDSTSTTPPVFNPASSRTIPHTAESDGERVAVQVLEPDDNGKGYKFDEIDRVTFNQKLCYSVGSKALGKGDKKEFKFTVKDANLYGEYTIRKTVTKADGTTQTYHDYMLYLSDADINNCISAFKNFVAGSQTTMRDLIDEWSDNKPGGRKYFGIEKLPEALKTKIPSGFDLMFERLCDLYEKEDGKMDDIEDVIDCINAAYIMSMYEAGDVAAVKEALKNYDGDMCGLYKRIYKEDNEGNITITEIIDAKEYSEMYASLKTNIENAEALKSVMQWTVPLAFIQDGTRKDVEKAMEDYAPVLGYDAAYATDKNVTLAQAAMKIDTAKAASYYNTFDDVFEDAVDAVLADTEITTPPESYVPPVISGGVGAHGSRPAEPTKPEDEPTTPTTPVAPTEPETEKAPFNDISNIDWAKDHINTLYKEGIISGDGDGSFHPERHVTREEFLKMLIEALKIDVASKEAAEFDDCDPDAWYYPYVQIASSNKITKGISRKNFGIGQNITRQDMAVLLSKALAIKNVTAIESDYVFDDEGNIAEYAKSEVSKMYSIGMISGMGNGTFAPLEFTTRAQAAVIIGRALEFVGGASK